MPSVGEILRRQGDKLSKLNEQSVKMNEQLTELRCTNEHQAKMIKEIQLGKNFREYVTRAAEYTLPFRYIVEITITATTNRVPQPFPISPKGWFFADRVWASWRPTAGSLTGLWCPLSHSDPVIAVHNASGVGVDVPDVLDFDWEYEDARTNQSRQNESRTIPGDLLFRRDSDGYLLGGDPWAPATSITVAVTPRVAPDNAGVITFTFLGEQCLNTSERQLSQWVERKKLLGL